MSTTQPVDLATISTETVNQILEWTKSTVDFAKEQAPLICREIILWGQMECLFWILVGLIVGGLLSLVCFELGNHESKESEKLEDGYKKKSSESFAGVCYLASFVFAALGIIMVLNNLYWLIYIYFAPRLYIIQTLSEFLKK